jgi:glycosyltransferase involved in cell wall biosynthesis
MFVDSASTDDSSTVAEAMGIHAVRAPKGKGRAMARALLEAETPYVCFIDADIHGASGNIAGAIAAAVRSGRHDMVVGDFDDERGAVPSVTCAVYRPLVERLFPEAVGKYGRRPLSGFRALRCDWIPAPGRLPPDFGIEAYLNIAFAVRSAGRVTAVPVGRYRGRFRYKPRMGSEVGRTVLDLAEAHGRLAPSARPEWNTWLNVIVDHIATYRGDRSRRAAFVARLAELAARPLPPTRTNALERPARGGALEGARP